MVSQKTQGLDGVLFEATASPHALHEYFQTSSITRHGQSASRLRTNGRTRVAQTSRQFLDDLGIPRSAQSAGRAGSNIFVLVLEGRDDCLGIFRRHSENRRASHSRRWIRQGAGKTRQVEPSAGQSVTVKALQGLGSNFFQFVFEEPIKGWEDANVARVGIGSQGKSSDPARLGATLLGVPQGGVQMRQRKGYEKARHD
jgi:hypothetical protein